MNKLLLEKIRELSDENRFDEAVKVIEAAEPREGCCADLLVWKARYLQLGDKASVEQVDAILHTAVACDPESAEAWAELGWFLLNVFDKAREAHDAFSRALAIQAKFNTDLLTGFIRCARELNESSDEKVTKGLLTILVNQPELEAALSE